VDPSFILKAFERGADAVLVGGCHPGDCHYVTGNLNARRRFFLMRNLLDFLGIEQERFQVTWCSAAEGQKWAEVVDEVCESVSRIGPFEAYREMTASLIGPVKDIEVSDE
jgi:coenzyme F420-reducing hydrogenase delta subunit